MRFSESRIEKLLCSDGKKRSIHIWEPEAPQKVFLIIHGLMDHCGNYILPALFFKEHGIATVMQAQIGHDHKGPDHPGKVSFQHFEHLTGDVGLMLGWVKSQYPGLPVFIMGHSMGALVATHYGINCAQDAAVKGYIFSSPYFVNAVKVPKFMISLVGILANLLPRMIVPTEDFKKLVTHDEEIYKRQRKDENDGYVVSSVTIRSANEVVKAQAWIPGNIARWNKPLLVILAGDDRIAETASTQSLLSLIEPDLVSEHYYPENYHENFNEPNREEIFSRIIEWTETGSS